MEVESTKKEEEDARRRFIANMQKVSFVAALLEDANVERAPCFCCLQKIQRTCPHTVGEPGCKDYKLYSVSPEKVERKLLRFVLQVRRQNKQQAA